MDFYLSVVRQGCQLFLALTAKPSVFHCQIGPKMPISFQQPNPMQYALNPYCVVSTRRFEYLHETELQKTT